MSLSNLIPPLGRTFHLLTSNAGYNTHLILSKYDSAQLKLFNSALNKDFPGISLSKIHKSGSMTRVLPQHNLFELIPPNTPIAIRYDPNSLGPEDTITLPNILQS